MVSKHGMEGRQEGLDASENSASSLIYCTSYDRCLSTSFFQKT